MLNIIESQKHYERCHKYLAAGVGSNARLTPGMVPICHERGLGSKIYDVDGNEYIDYILALGPLILGHCPPAVVKAVKEQLERGSLFGSAAVGDDVLAKMVCDCFPSVDIVSFHNSSSEACHMALRLARAVTGKQKLLKFEGCYHGWIDDCLVSVHPNYIGAMGTEDYPQPVHESPGQLKSVIDNTIIAPLNNCEVLEKIFKRDGGEIAALMLEPIPANSGVVMLDKEYLTFLREITLKYDTMLIFDETITGFRVSLGGAQEYYNVMPDLTVFGKSAGGGYAFAGFGGNNEIMKFVSNGTVNRMGTFNANQISVAAATAVISELSKNNGVQIKKMNLLGKELMKGIENIFIKANLPIAMVGPGSFFSALFIDKPMKNYRDSFQINVNMYSKYWLNLLERGIRVWSTPRSLWFMSTAHDKKDIEITLDMVKESVHELGA